jgi:bile acid-coenzyme A ligase
LGGPTVLNTPEGGTVVMGGPLYHNAPYHVAVQGLVRGLPIVVFERFDPELLLLAIDRYKARSALVVPTHMSRAMKLPANIRSKYDLSSINQLWHSAAPCSIDVKEAWLEWVGAEKVYEQYSSSEALAATLIRGDEWLEHRGSVGRVCRGEMKIVDPETGIDLDCGQIGEIYMRLSPDGNTGFRYIGADLKTNHEGWASVGDLGHFDEDGYLYFADRRLDMIISGGANIYPAEVENALLRHPSVVSCAVIGLPDDDLGQKVHAIVQTDNPDVREGDLTEFLLTQIVRYKIPRSLEIVDWSVRDDAGKVRRSALREERVGK